MKNTERGPKDMNHTRCKSDLDMDLMTWLWLDVDLTECVSGAAVWGHVNTA